MSSQIQKVIEEVKQYNDSYYYTYNKDDVISMLKTQRVKIGNNTPITVQWIMKNVNRGSVILDYGCGYNAVHVELLRSKGYKFVYGYDFAVGSDIPYTTPVLFYPYDIIYASNVLNVQPNYSCFNFTLKEIHTCMTYFTKFVCNYPVSPRKLPVDNRTFIDMLLTVFHIVNIDSFNKSTIYICKK